MANRSLPELLPWLQESISNDVLVAANITVNGMVRLKVMFPELTTQQFSTCSLYALGLDAQSIATNSGLSCEAVKKRLQRSKDSLNLDDLKSLRSLFIMRSLWCLLGSNLAQFPISN